jgi:hypothetical protein
MSWLNRGGWRRLFGGGIGRLAEVRKKTFNFRQTSFRLFALNPHNAQQLAQLVCEVGGEFAILGEHARDRFNRSPLIKGQHQKLLA